MSIYTNLTTKSLTDTIHSSEDFKANDKIITTGFYEAGDGGGAEFIVSAGAVENEYFEHRINGTSLKAVMVIKNGIVNIDQLGAKGDAVLPDTYYDTVTNAGECDKRTESTFDANLNAFDNKKILDTACTKDFISEVQLSYGKIYCIKEPFKINSDHVLNGNGATIMSNAPKSRINIINCQGSPDNFKENIEIKNLRLISNHLFSCAGNTSKGIYIINCRNIHIHDITIERSGYGIHTTISNKGFDFNTVSIHDVKITDVIMGIQAGDLEDSNITNSYISCDYNLLYSDKTDTNPAESRKGNHCIYIGSVARNCVFENLTLKNAGFGNAINRNWADGETDFIGASHFLTFRNIIIDNCKTALFINHNTHNSLFTNIIATNVRGYGLNLCGIRNVTISNCDFSGHPDFPDGGGFYIPTNKVGSPNYYVNDLVIENCNFTFEHKFLSIEEGRNMEGDNMIIRNCRFFIHVPNIGYREVPAFVKGVFSHVLFFNCIFETDGFEKDFLHGNIQNAHSKNGVFFYFSSERIKPMYWSFDSCKFINNGTTSVNSPILSNRANDEYCGNIISKTIHCTMKNCVLVGFRWTIRVATAQDTSNVSGINPCYFDIGEDTNTSVDAAITALNNKQRFCAHKNIHQYSEITEGVNDSYYVKASEFGI